MTSESRSQEKIKNLNAPRQARDPEQTKVRRRTEGRGEKPRSGVGVVPVKAMVLPQSARRDAEEQTSNSNGNRLEGRFFLLL